MASRAAVSSSSSAGELRAAAMTPYYGTDVAIVGRNTFGKPVGQIARDLDECDDRLRIVAFRTENGDRQGDYFDGLAFPNGDWPGYPATCSAADDVFTPFGNANEDSIATALDFIQGGQNACTPITSTANARTLQSRDTRIELMPANPSYAQRVLFGQI